MSPQLSVVVAGSRPEGPPEAMFRALHSLLECGDVELLIATARSGIQVRWPGTRIVQCAPGSTVPAMRLAGVRAATAPVIALTEDFCVPAEGWAECLLAARSKLDAAVLGGPIARRSGRPADWALTFAEYGRFFRREPEGEVADLPSVNVVYDADRLRAALPAGVSGIFEVELHASLRMRGNRFWRLPGAVMFDENEVQLVKAMCAQYYHGRLFGGGRARDRDLFSKLIRCVIAPAVPAILLSRIAREASAAGHATEVWRALPALLLLLGAWAAGEGIGSLFGAGNSGSRWT